MKRKHIFGFALGFGALLTPIYTVQAQTPSPSQSTAKEVQAQPTAPRKVGQAQNEGERIFNQNCSRCHTAPEGFSSRISGTIVRHMRVRAQLSQHDEQELLRFFNP